MARIPTRGPVRVSAEQVRRRTRGFGFIGETYGELKRVTWPTREEVTRLTILVITISAAIGLILGAIDATFSQGFSVFLFR